MGGLTAEKVGLAMGLTTAAGLCTTIGAFLVFFANLANRKFLAGSLGFSAGVMIYLSFVELLADEAVEEIEEHGVSADHAFMYANLCFFGGILVTYGLDLVVHKLLAGKPDMHHADLDMMNQVEGRPAAGTTGAATDSGGAEASEHESTDAENEAEDFVEDILHPTDRAVSRVEGVPEHDVQRLAYLYEQEKEDGMEAATKKYSRLDKSSIVTALAVGIHNFPEGLAVFFATIADGKLGGALAVAIAVHNIPEGVAVALPVYYSSRSKLKAFLWCFWSGMAEPLGGLLGWLILSLADESPLALGIMFGLVGGMMVYISIQELFVTALAYDPKNKLTGHFAFAGMFVMALSLVLFKL
eukprot:jgi/Pico_ML_1/51792/g2639.t1